MPVIFSLFLFGFKLQNQSIKYFINSQVKNSYQNLIVSKISYFQGVSYFTQFHIQLVSRHIYNIHINFIILIKCATMFLFAPIYLYAF